MKATSFWISILLVSGLSACQPANTSLPSTDQKENPAALPAPTETAAAVKPLAVSITLDNQNINKGITQDSGGDVDTIVVQVDGGKARKSGNGNALASADGNVVPDLFFQFNVDDKQMYAGSPTTHVRVEVDYLDRARIPFHSSMMPAQARHPEGSSLAAGRW
jgi:hypothetical protein